MLSSPTSLPLAIHSSSRSVISLPRLPAPGSPCLSMVTLQGHSFRPSCSLHFAPFCDSLVYSLVFPLPLTSSFLLSQSSVAVHYHFPLCSSIPVSASNLSVHLYYFPSHLFLHFPLLAAPVYHPLHTLPFQTSASHPTVSGCRIEFPAPTYLRPFVMVPQTYLLRRCCL